MIKKNWLLLLILCWSIQFLKAQNLIPNAGFEEKEIKTYDTSGKYFRAKDWDWIQPRGQYGPWTGMHIDKTLIPSIKSRLNYHKDVSFNPIYPYEGNCYMRSLGCKYKNVVQAKLKQPIMKGVVYYFEMYYRVDANKIEEEVADPFLINQADFGVVFRTKNSFDIPFMYNLYKNKITLNPFISIKLNDSTPIKQWTKFTAYFIPTMDYSYLLIGNFKDLGQHNPKIWEGICQFYIDNLFLTPYENMLSKDLQSVNKPFVLEGIYFKENEPEFETKSIYTLDILFNFLKINPKKSIEINCYTIKNQENNILSKQRAQAIANYLIEYGISATRILYIGKDEMYPATAKLSLSEQMKINKIEITIKP